MTTQQMSLFGDESTPAMPSGFRYQPDLIDAEEEAALVRAIAQMQLTPYEFRGFLAHRKVTGFGFRYSYRSRRMETAPPMPPLLSGAARMDWEHSIPEVSQLRYSLTFRTLAHD